MPAIVFAPGLMHTKMKGTTYDGMMHHVDWYTTFMSLAEVSAMESEQELDGYDHWDAMRGLAEAPRTMIVYDINLVFDNVNRGWGNVWQPTSPAASRRAGEHQGRNVCSVA